MWNVALIVGTPRFLGMCTGGLGPNATLDKLRGEDICRLRTAAFSEVDEDTFDLSSQETVSSSSFGKLPILVFSHDRAKSLPAKPSQAELDRQDAWAQMQENLKNLTTRGRRIIAKNGSHHVMIDRPDLLEKEVPAFIEQTRGFTPQPATYWSTETE
jgi:hypothetical protein